MRFSNTARRVSAKWFSSHTMSHSVVYDAMTVYVNTCANVRMCHVQALNFRHLMRTLEIIEWTQICADQHHTPVALPCDFLLTWCESQPSCFGEHGSELELDRQLELPDRQPEGLSEGTSMIAVPERRRQLPIVYQNSRAGPRRCGVCPTRSFKLCEETKQICVQTV